MTDFQILTKFAYEVLGRNFLNWLIWKHLLNLLSNDKDKASSSKSTVNSVYMPFLVEEKQDLNVLVILKFRPK